MNHNQFQDLKQFILVTVLQATADMVSKADIVNMATKADITNMATKQDIAELKAMISDVDLKLDTIANALTEDLSEHERRITVLEPQAA